MTVRGDFSRRWADATGPADDVYSEAIEVLRPYWAEHRDLTMWKLFELLKVTAPDVVARVEALFRQHDDMISAAIDSIGRRHLNYPGLETCPTCGGDKLPTIRCRVCKGPA